MNIGDEILIKAKIVDFDANPYGAAVKVEIIGFMDRSEEIGPFGKTVKIWIHRIDQPKVIQKITDNEPIDQLVILNPR